MITAEPGRKLAPWELERKLAREKKAKRQAKYRCYLPIDGRKHGRALTVKRANHVSLQDKATFCCPSCKHDVRIDLIRIRPDFYDCRNCGHKFVKVGIVDEFDYDYEGCQIYVK